MEEKPRKIDARKITSIEEIKIILDCLDLRIHTSSPNYEKLKHLTDEDESDGLVIGLGNHRDD